MMNPNSPIVSVGSPVLVDGVRRRLTQFANGTYMVESFINGSWVVGGCSVKQVRKGTPDPDPPR